MENSGQSVVNPIVKYLTEIIDDISKGDLRVPNFQRPYVWKQSDVISLFDSIYKGYPIGSLLFWETSEKLESFSKIGPFELNHNNHFESNYIIDGHQRLSTLYGILQTKKRINNISLDSWSLFFDLDKNEFYFKTSNTKATHYIAMDKIINTIDFLEECKRIQNEDSNNFESYINKAQKLAQAIITYKVPITQIKKGNLTSAVEIFSRLNTKGTDMTPDQMLSALTYTEGENSFKLADKIDNIIEKLVVLNFSDIDRIFLFRAIIAAAKKDIYNVKLEDLARDKKINLPKIVDECEHSIFKAVEFLVETLKVPNDKFLPYNLQLVFLSEFFFIQPNPDKNQIKELIKWFWFTSYSGWFAGANSSKIRNGLEDIRAFAQKSSDSPLAAQDYNTRTVEMPDKFDVRFARVKAFVLFLIKLDPQPLETSISDHLSSRLTEHGIKALHQVIPNEVNAFENRMILGPVKLGYAKNVLTDFSVDIPDNILKSHAISHKALKAIRSYDFKLFLHFRKEEIVRLESEFIESYGLTYKSKTTRHIPKNQMDLFNTFT